MDEETRKRILDHFDGMKGGRSYVNELSQDRTVLHLSYYGGPRTVDQRHDYTEAHTRLFEALDVYDSLQTLIISTDFMNQLPEACLKFTCLEALVVKGTRWWDLNMQFVPKSVKKVEFIDQSNLMWSCVNHIERLTNLSQLFLDLDLEENDDPDEFTQALPYLPSLREVSFTHNKEDFVRYKKGIQAYFTERPFFQNYNVNFDNVEVHEETLSVAL